ncbi:hypothetical protein PAXRUDRAFT_153727 [Paxillus rubicundulus Ve08.2h10]|uniref:Uncharacterized protein n=1 Tax=Paxillus rubicundulus Ve08.2h10 TaxID=930991 RepID=A0A0D0DDR2_9AGAM|nr:hypothetical protein PAXRUDRAFT_153727 [Paxillus rubicundulus Ve08.2h10]
MSTQHLTISCPNLSQSILHMGLYCLGCQINSAVLHLIHQPVKYWPGNWQWVLDREFQSLHAMQQIHATCPTTAIPAPAVQGIYQVSCKNLQMALWAFNMRNCTMSTSITTFLCNWDPMLADNFQGKWWDNNAEHNGNEEEYDVWADTLTSRHKYFQASIIIFMAEWSEQHLFRIYGPCMRSLSILISFNKSMKGKKNC